MSAPKTPFSALSTELQAVIKHLLAPMIGKSTYDLRFSEDEVRIVPSKRGYTLEELRTWSEVSKYFVLSAEGKRRVPRLTEQNPATFLDVCFTTEGELYNTGIFGQDPAAVFWNEVHGSKDWPSILFLDGPDAPSGDSCSGLEIKDLEGELVDVGNEDLRTENLALRAKLKGLEADMRGTMIALKDCQERLESIKGILA